MIDVVEIDDRIAKCERILAVDSQSQIFAALADAHRKRGDIARAYAVCYQGLMLHPDYASARIVMTKIHLARDNYEQALMELERAIDIAGRTRSTDLLEAEILIKRGRKSEAAAIIDRLSGSDPEDENVKRLLELIEKEETTSVRVESQPEPYQAPVAGSAHVPGSAPVAGPRPSQPSPQPPHRKTMSLGQAIGLLKITSRVLGVLAVGNEGLILEARFDSNYSKEEFGALSKGIFDNVVQGMTKAGLGGVFEVQIETGSSKIWIIKKQKYFLVVYSRDDVSMGALKLKVDELFGNVEM
jgi:predicted regulator of Ras-like GTPase activity (Roadblock/LC7/MglB family)